MEANVEIPASQTNQQPLQPSKPANNSHRLLHKKQHVEPVTEQGTSSERGHYIGCSRLPACVIESLFNNLKTISALQPGLDLSSLAGRRQPHHRSSSHAVCQDTTAGSTSQLHSA